MTCGLCGSSTAAFASVPEHGTEKIYLRCDECALIQLDPAQRLSASEEKARYDLHNNDPSDDRYLDFLKRLADPLCERLEKGAEGLDFGCGPAPALADILTGRGFPARAYDPIYFPDSSALSRRYGFVAMSEVIEHFREPGAELEKLDRLVEKGGFLAIMTTPYEGERPFGEWWYRRDPTHVSFFSGSTMNWIARHMGWSIETPSKTVTLFRKPS